MNLDLPEREEVVEALMRLYDWTFYAIFVLAIITISYCVWHLIPKREY
jgi:hypothetical protein